MLIIVPIDTGLDLKAASDQILFAVEAGLDVAADKVKQDFLATTETWQNKPTFDVQHDPLKRTIGTDDKVYGWVNDGTAGHIIQPRQARILRFPSQVTPKTRPRVIGSGPTTRENEVFAMQVFNPGVDAREFDNAIAEKWTPLLPAIIQGEINKGG